MTVQSEIANRVTNALTIASTAFSMKQKSREVSPSPKMVAGSPLSAAVTKRGMTAGLGLLALATASPVGAVLAPRFGLDQPPNFEEPHVNKRLWHLRVYQTMEQIAERTGQPAETLTFEAISAGALDGRIVASGGAELAHQLEEEGYDRFLPAGVGGETA